MEKYYAVYFNDEDDYSVKLVESRTINEATDLVKGESDYEHFVDAIPAQAPYYNVGDKVKAKIGSDEFEAEITALLYMEDWNEVVFSLNNHRWAYAEQMTKVS